MQSVNLTTNWYKLKAVPTFWSIDVGGDSSKILAYYKQALTSDAIVRVSQYASSWVDLHRWDAWESAAAFKSAYVAYVLSVAKKEYSTTTITAYDTTTEPFVVYDSAKTFSASPFAGCDAYVKFKDTEIDDHVLQVFVTTSYYTGPGTYDLLTSNRRIVRVVLDHDKLSGKRYKIISQSSKLALAVQGGATAEPQAHIIQATDDGSVGQQWLLRLTMSQGYSIVSCATNRVIDVPGGSANAGTGICQWTDGGPTPSTSQQWRFVERTDGAYEILAVCSGMGLNVPGSSTVSGTQMVQWPIGNTPNERWTLVPLP